MTQAKKDRSPKVGDRIVVGHWTQMKTVIERIESEYMTDRIQIIVDWGEFGLSRVWLHDYGKTWTYYEYLN